MYITIYIYIYIERERERYSWSQPSPPALKTEWVFHGDWLDTGGGVGCR